MEITTGSDGKYYFPYLTINKYKVVQINPTGYESVRDKDVINDNIIAVSYTHLTLPTSDLV